MTGHKNMCYGFWFVVIFLLDRLSKYMALGLAHPYRVNQFLEFRLAFNRGISWSLLHSEDNRFFVILSCFIIGIILVLMHHTYKRIQAGRTIYAELAVLAGALSNVIDRFFYYGVIDFIHVHIGDWSWPIFNIADTAIVFGVLWMIKEHYQEQ